MEAGVVRIRVKFADHGHILKKSLRSKGLKRSWVLLKPSHRTISDLSEYIIDFFDLRHSCRNGIVLSMDGFVLPPFESASILRDKDVIGVKSKGQLLSEIEVDDGQTLLEEGEIVEKQALVPILPLLANEEFEKESGGYQSEHEEQEGGNKGNQSADDLYEEESPDKNEASKKRKASKKLGSSKKKKKKRLMDLQVSDDNFCVDENASNGFHLGEGSNKKKKESEVKKKRRRASTLVSVGSSDDTSQPLPSPKRSSPIQENGTGCGASSQAPNGTEKKPSRSARRKKAKRQWLREIVKAEKGLFLLSDNTSQPGSCDVQLKKTKSPEINVNKHSVECQRQNQSCEADNEVAPDTDPVPIVIRPGHIRFEPLEEDADGEALQQRHVPVQIIQWNGITNKKKGQKWGKEKSTFWRNESHGSKTEGSETTAIEEVKPSNDPIDFDNLAPLSCLPREGDLIAYRLVELSSTWTPELTSFRVGKISWYDSKSNKILLAPLPEYPIKIEKQDDEDTFAQPPDNLFYKEDGSLEVDFSSLVDVRMIKESDQDPAKSTSDQADVPVMSNGATSSAAIPTGNEKNENAWDEISEALSAKKVELMRENSWMKENSGRGGWSYRAMRGSAMGPIMARLRANNEI